MRFKLPAEIVVAGRTFTIEDFPPELADGKRRYGEFDYGRELIRVELGAYSPFHILNTLLHEINHAIYWMYKIMDTDNEETIVDTMATAWVQVYTDNPDLLKFINQVMRSKK